MSGSSWKRTHTCGELREEHVGQSVVLNGWVAGRRDLGGIFFVDLRDRYGITQIALTQEQGDAVPFSTEFVLSVRGEVVRRESPNADLPTGAIELRVEEFEVLSSSPTPPFEIKDGLDTAVELRLQHRYLDRKSVV